MLHVILIHNLCDSFNPHCRQCLRLERCVWIFVSCWVITALKLNMYVCACMCLRGFICVCVCVWCLVSQNLPCGGARPWASVRRVCARPSPLCPLKLCRQKLSNFSRSVSPPLTLFLVCVFCFIPLSFDFLLAFILFPEFQSLFLSASLTVRACSKHYPSYSSLFPSYPPLYPFLFAPMWGQCLPQPCPSLPSCP